MATDQYPVRSRGIVAYSVDDWRMEDLWARAPGHDEVLVEMVATGVCHTDISGYGDIYPRVLGHEGAGRIVQIGGDGGSLEVGDLVILSAASCQTCHYCCSGHPAYCLSHGELTLHANQADFVLARDPMVVVGGGYFGQSSFASPALVKVSSATKAPAAAVGDARALMRFAPLGCGIMTGTGAITHVAQCTSADVLAVIGLGGVGLAAVCAAKYLAVGTILAVDLLESRLELARSLGATETLLATDEALDTLGTDLPAAIKARTPHQLGCTHVLDTSPSVAVLSACLEALRNNGTVLQVGVKPAGAKIELDTLTHMVHGRRLVGVIEGDRDPHEAIPELVQWATDGTLPVEKLFKEFPVDQFKDARARMEKGDVIKAVLVW